jgi:hypothetical protein
VIDSRLLVAGSLSRMILLLGDRALALWLRLALEAARSGRTTFDPLRLRGTIHRAPRRALDDLVDLAVLGLVTLDRGVVHDAPTVTVNTWSGDGFVDVVAGTARDPRPLRPVITPSAIETRASRRAEARRARDRRRKRLRGEVRRRVDGDAALNALRPFTPAERSRLSRMKSKGIPPTERALAILAGRGART